MYKAHCDTINSGDNVIVALGDSFTQGVGAYSSESWASASKIGPLHSFNLSGNHFIPEQAKNNWASQLRDNHFPDYKIWNLGVSGAGNRAAVKELYLNPIPKNLGNVVVILLATGIDRFDFYKNSYSTAGENNHQRWQTIWPITSDRGTISVIETAYAELLYSPKVTALEFLFNIADVQNYCKARGYKFLFAPVFDKHSCRDAIVKDLTNESHYANMVDWDDFMEPPEDKTFTDMICRLEKHPDIKQYIDLHRVGSKLPGPLKYITPCMHWTIEGQRVVSDCIADELIKRNLL
jgi:hypothetical protein